VMIHPQTQMILRRLNIHNPSSSPVGTYTHSIGSQILLMLGIPPRSGSQRNQIIAAPRCAPSPTRLSPLMWPGKSSQRHN
jgi:hypothetical protein